MNDGTHSDAWCRDNNNVVPPVASMRAHTAPLGMTFYRPDTLAADAPFALPSSDGGDQLFVTQHGSWNRNTPTGYKLVRYNVTDSGSSVDIAAGQGEGEDILRFDSNSADTDESLWPYRPVDVVRGWDGELFISDDAEGTIIAMRYVVGGTNFTDSSSSTGGAGGAAAAIKPQFAFTLAAMLILVAARQVMLRE